MKLLKPPLNINAKAWKLWCTTLTFFPISSTDYIPVEEMSRTFRDILTAHLNILQYNINKNLTSMQNIIETKDTFDRVSQVIYDVLPPLS